MDTSQVILGTDIAELLVENYESSVGSAEFDRLDKSREMQETNKLSHAEVTKKFRQLLLQGNKTEALGKLIVSLSIFLNLLLTVSNRIECIRKESLQIKRKD